MQTEVQEKRAWVPREQFLEGLALVNTLPGPERGSDRDLFRLSAAPDGGAVC